MLLLGRRLSVLIHYHFFSFSGFLVNFYLIKVNGIVPPLPFLISTLRVLIAKVKLAIVTLLELLLVDGTTIFIQRRVLFVFVILHNSSILQVFLFVLVQLVFLFGPLLMPFLVLAVHQPNEVACGQEEEDSSQGNESSHP
mmetsp:Transcript_35535/g.34559  ORF Transcript_35535/g.34559 Transcript_35535/m.34559 type:complete len:140 (-) Transcript_35535:171-590(-)